MRKTLIPAILAASLALSGVAFAASQDAKGAIKAIDAKAMTVTLDDGTVYFFTDKVKLDAFKVGEKVTIVWEMKDKAHDASAITAN
jgi:Cu/Ag efflux protein CusF